MIAGNLLRITSIASLAIVMGVLFSFAYDNFSSPHSTLFMILLPVLCPLVILFANYEMFMNQFEVNDRKLFILYLLFVSTSIITLYMPMIAYSLVTTVFVYFTFYIASICLSLLLGLFAGGSCKLVYIITYGWSLFVSLSFLLNPHFELTYWNVVFGVHMTYVVVAGLIAFSKFKLEPVEKE